MEKELNIAAILKDKPNGTYVVKTAMFDAPVLRMYKRITRLMETL